MATLQNLSLATISIFIAVAIFLVDKDANNFELDRKVILNKVIEVKPLVIFFALLFAPLLFWDMSPNSVKMVLITVFTYSFWKVAKSLYRTYKWMDGFEPKDSSSKKDNYRMALRLDYLKKIYDSGERHYEWSYLWNNSKGLSSEEINQYFTVFSTNINDLIRNNKFIQSSRYLSNFTGTLGNLPLHDWILYERLLKESLHWHKLSFDLSKNKKESDIKGEEGNPFYIEANVETLIRELTVAIVKHKTDYIFFRLLKKHIDENLKDREYVIKTIGFISSVLFNLESDNLYSIFSNYFPEEWKIKENELKDNLVQITLLNNYLNWAQRKIWDSQNQKNNKFDSNLETVTYQLFPEIDPSTWAYWLTFLINPYPDNKRVEEFLKTHKIFGFGSRVITYTGEHTQEEINKMLNKSIAGQIKATHEFLIKRFPVWFSVEKLKKYKSEVQSLQFEEHDIKLLRKKSFIKQLDAIIRLQEKKKPKVKV